MRYGHTIKNLPRADDGKDNMAPVRALVAKLKKDRGSGSLPPFLTLPSERSDLDLISGVAEQIREQAQDVVVLGTGGSSLGAQMLVGLKGLQLAENGANGSPRMHFPDNLGPHTMAAMLKDLDLLKTHFIVISKSGGTAETLAQMMACLAAVRRLNGGTVLVSHFTVIVQPGDNMLRRLSRRWRLRVLDHDRALGGRFSVLSNVGLLPAAIAGLDILALREGAEDVFDQLLAANDLQDVPAVAGATAIYDLSVERGINVNVMMPYDSRLERFTNWHQQLWAESLGKDGRGTTPVRALGPVDQHSQLQLFLGGPEDKFFTFITADMKGLGPVIDSDLASDPELGYMSGRTIGDLVAAEARATMEALVRHGRPVRHMALEKLDEKNLGAVVMHFMLETVIAASLFEVNPYDQPSVEEGKRLTREYLEREFGGTGNG